jgi:hypothetical protein
MVRLSLGFHQMLQTYIEVLGAVGEEFFCMLCCQCIVFNRLLSETANLKRSEHASE